jgi:hypothetical protein
MGSLENKLPDVMGDKIPDFTGPSVQLPEPPKKQMQFIDE